jgi:hypothetical protein
MQANLIEICCKCGFVHRDDRHSLPKQRKLYYYWMPENNEKVKNGYTLHATICASCIEPDGMVDWSEYDEQRKKTPIEYGATSYNAELPKKYRGKFDIMYYMQAEYFDVENV